MGQDIDSGHAYFSRLQCVFRGQWSGLHVFGPSTKKHLCVLQGVSVRVCVGSCVRVRRHVALNSLRRVVFFWTRRQPLGTILKLFCLLSVFEKLQ